MFCAWWWEKVRAFVCRTSRESLRLRFGQAADFHVGVLAGAHGDEVPPCPEVPGHDDASFGGVGQNRASGLTRLFAA